MMIFTDGQLVMMRSRAGFLLSKLKEWEKHDDKTKISFILADFQEICSVGHSIALDEVHSTPWEYEAQPIRTSRDVNEETMNGYAERGWELQFISSGWMFWRRRKAVGEMKAET